MMENKIPNYRQARFLHAMISQLSLPLVAADFRVPLFKLKQKLDPVLDKLNDEQMILFLMNDGVEKETQKGKVYTYPDVPAKGSDTDELYAAKLKGYLAVKRNLDFLLRQLDEQPCGERIEPIFTEAEFEDFCKSIHNIEMIDCKDLLVKS